MQYLSVFVVVFFIINFINLNARICENVHIFHSARDLEKSLRGCTAVIGYLKITLFERNVTEVEFPELTTITGYLMIYRVYGLTSVAKLFPNLSIIGGDVLMTDYALVLYDLPHLQEIGLSNLRYIGRGAIRIDRCPHLCFVNTVDWSSIGGNPHSLHYFNTNVGDCPWCPEYCEGTCWNQKHCQKGSFQNCGSDCLLCGDSNKCDLCKNYNHNDTCVLHCPKDKFGHLSLHTCVTRDECVSIGYKNWLIFNDECKKTCPEGYEKVQKTEGWCQFCGNNCTKVCSGDHIRDIQDADEYRGCTHITGNLEIYVSISVTVEILTHGLGNIRVIDGYLKISDSSGLTSLNFLKNLKVISGNTLYEQRYSLAVFNNKNLRQLWNWNNSKIILEKGIIMFHYNPKLCRAEIDNLVKFSRLNRTITKYDICPLSNGEETSCRVIKAEVNVDLVNATQATVKWNTHYDAVGYILYYKEDMYQNASINEIEKVCLDPSEQGWFTNYTTENKAILLDLHPFTSYAFYIQVCTETSYFAGHTDVYRFKTQSGEPSPLHSVKISRLGSNDIELEWVPPKYPGGIITYYEISQYLLNDSLELIEHQDYCHFRNWNSEIPSDSSVTNCCKTKIWNEQIHYNLKAWSSNEMFGNRTLVKVNNLTTSYTFSNLKHYRIYGINIRVCNNLPSCSYATVIFRRTQPFTKADNIDSGVILNQVKNSIHVKWEPPADPNSYIVSYIVQYKNVDNEHFQINTECVTIHDYLDYQGHLITNLSDGNYSVTVTAISLYGPGNTSDPVYLYITVNETASSALDYCILTALIVCVISMLIVYWYERKRKDQKIILYSDELINRSALELSVEDHSPTYGIIQNGVIKSQNRPCTVKFAPKHRNSIERAEFLKEAIQMRSVKNAYHVVSSIGLVFPEDPPIIVMELMAWGDLKSYLIRSRDSNEITDEHTVRMAAEIADGMFYLSSQHLTHPDLAARNCMVTAGRTVKIVIFGINKDIYANDYYNHKTKGVIPVRWMAPETIADSVVTINSNVWSYGIVLWEIVTGAEQPYENLSNEEVVNFVIGQHAMERPAKCDDLLYYVMSNCWKWKSDSRINFLSILEHLVRCVRQDFGLVSFYNSSDGVEYSTVFKDKLKLIDKDLSVRWKVKDETVSLVSTVSECVVEDLNLPSTSTRL